MIKKTTTKRFDKKLNSPRKNLLLSILITTAALEITADTDKCFLESPMPSIKIDCSCEEVTVSGKARSNCISQSIYQDRYHFCLGDFDSGFKECRNDLVKVGSKTKCIQERDMEKILAHTTGFGAVGGLVGMAGGAVAGFVYGAGVGSMPASEFGAMAGATVGGGIGMVYGYLVSDDCSFVSCKPSRNQSDKEDITKQARTYSSGNCKVGG